MARNFLKAAILACAPLLVPACGSQPAGSGASGGQASGNQVGATNSAATVVGDETPAAGGNAPTPVSGSGDVPANAHDNNARETPSGQTAE